VDIAYEFKKIRVLFADDGLVAVLEQVACAFVAFIESDGVIGHEFPHDLAERDRAGAQEQVKMVRDQGPGVTLGLGLLENDSKPSQEGFPVFVIKKELAAFDSPGHDVLEEAGGV